MIGVGVYAHLYSLVYLTRFTPGLNPIHSYTECQSLLYWMPFTFVQIPDEDEPIDL